MKNKNGDIQRTFTGIVQIERHGGMARRAFHATHRPRVCAVLEPSGRSPECHHDSVDLPRLGRRLDVPLQRPRAQHLGRRTADVRQFLRLNRRPNGASDRQKNAHRTDARRFFGRHLVCSHLRGHRVAADARKHPIYEREMGHLGVDFVLSGRRFLSFAAVVARRLLSPDSPLFSVGQKRQRTQQLRAAAAHLRAAQSRWKPRRTAVFLQLRQLLPQSRASHAAVSGVF